MNIDLSKKELFLFDLDGVFYKGKENRVKIGGSEIIPKLREKGKKIFVLTNNSTDTIENIHANLVEFNIPIAKDEILTSGMLAGEYILREYGKVNYFLIGERGLELELNKFGHRRTLGTNADVLVIGLDRRLTYSKLDKAAHVVWNGADIIATHDSRVYMYKYGPAIAAGPIVRAIEYATNKRAIVIGKPSHLMFDIALKKAGCKREQAVMIGDQIETDIIGAHNAGIDSILVLTGVDKNKDAKYAKGTIGNIDELVLYI